MISQFQIGVKTYYENSQRRTKLRENIKIVKKKLDFFFFKSLKIQNLQIFFFFKTKCSCNGGMGLPSWEIFTTDPVVFLQEPFLIGIQILVIYELSNL